MTPKQEAFCLAHMETGNASEAYRRCYDASNMKPESIYVEACKLMSHPDVSLRLEELRTSARNYAAITVEGLIDELERARQAALAAEPPQISAAIAATMGKAKLSGFPNKEVLTDPIKRLTNEQIKERLKVLTGKLGYIHISEVNK